MHIVVENEFRSNANFFIDRCVYNKCSVLIHCKNGERLVLKNVSYCLDDNIEQLKALEEDENADEIL